MLSPSLSISTSTPTSPGSPVSRRTAPFLHISLILLPSTDPSLPSHPQHELAKKLKHGSGGMTSFSLKGDNDGTLGRAMIDKLACVIHCANVGDVRTLVVNPSATVQRQLDAEELLKSGTPPNLVRVSLGLEDPEDIIAGELWDT